MNTTLIYNRDGGLANGGWIQIVPKGELPNREAGIIQVLDDKALDAILANIEMERRRLGENWPGIYIGVEHHIYDESLSSEALGWAKQFKRDSKGIWARPEWTDIGEEAISNRRFKYTSFVVPRPDPDSTEPLGENRLRILKIETIGLTNLPNGKELLQPISNRAAATERGQSGNHPPSMAVQRMAARKIDNLAREEQRVSGGSLASCFTRVMNREKELAEIAGGKRACGQSTAKLSGSKEGSADFAAGMLMELAEHGPVGTLSQKLVCVRNRSPRLARMESSEAGWDALADLEPAAHAAYLEAVNNPNQYSRELDEARDKMRAQFPQLPEDGRWGKIVDAYPALVAKAEIERMVSAPRFRAALRSVTVEFPDLGCEGRWSKVKERYPRLFWRFVLSVGSKSERQP